MAEGLTPEEYHKKVISINSMHHLLSASVFYLKGIIELISLMLISTFCFVIGSS